MINRKRAWRLADLYLAVIECDEERGPDSWEDRKENWADYEDTFYI